MEKGEIRLRKVIVHILDSTVGMPVLSDALLDYGSDFGDFLREHICRIETTDEMETKQIIHDQLAETGAVSVPFVLDQVFKEKEEYKEEVQEKLEKYKMGTALRIEPQSESTARKFEKQHLTTDTGVEIKIPMEQYQDGEHIEFITNPDGSISILIKNVGRITSK